MTNIFSTTKINQTSNQTLSVSYKYSWFGIFLYYARWMILPIIFVLIYFINLEIVPLDNTRFIILLR
ncbi:MAG: hypothetical protein AB8G11_11040 [Saprospiraceae bacterium]